MRKIFKQKNNFENLLTTVKNIVEYSQLSISHNTIKETLQAHPSYPSLLSLSHSLLGWNVKSLSIKISIFQLESIPLPAIAHIKKSKDTFVVLTKVEEKIVFYIDAEVGETVEESIDDFGEKWSGHTLLLEKNPYSGELNFKEKSISLFREKIIRRTFFILLSLIVFGMILFKMSPIEGCLSILKILGGLVSGILILKELGSNNDLLNKVCSWKKTTNCQDVLNSAASNFFGYRLSEIGLIYFLGGFLVLIFAMIKFDSNSILSFLFWVNILALPYTFFSIYYQSQVVKKWCPLCVAIQGILWCEFICYILLGDSLFLVPFDFESVFLGLFGFFFPLVIWQIIKPYLFQFKTDKSIVQQLDWFKKETTIFNALLKEKPSVDSSSFFKELIIGRQEADNILTVVTSFSCNACRKVHPQLELIPYLFDDVKIQIRFAIKKDDKAIRHMMRLIISEKENKAQEALSELFKSKNIETWKSQFPLPQKMNESLINKLIVEHQEWFKSTKVNYTPAFFLNGQLLPHIYSMEDLKIHFLNL